MLVEVHALGVLLLGASGSGKSELALELVARGHKLVADDVVDWKLAGNGRISGSAPALLRGFIEVRGLGILNACALYGEDAVAAEAMLDLVIALDSRAGILPQQRLGGRRSTFSVLGVAIPAISLPGDVGHNLAVLVEAACRDHRLRNNGYHADQDLAARQSALIGQQGSPEA